MHQKLTKYFAWCWIIAVSFFYCHCCALLPQLIIIIELLYQLTNVGVFRGCQTSIRPLSSTKTKLQELHVLASCDPVS